MFIEDLISHDLLVEVSYIRELNDKAPNLYKKFMIGQRRIDAPTPELKLVQSWISDFIRDETPDLPSYISAYERGSSIRNNASIHKDNYHLLCLDVNSFFHSCSETMVRGFYKTISFCEPGTNRKRKLNNEEINLLISLSIYRGSLSMGSPCSPAIANRIMLPVDLDIQDRLGHGYSYSRYSDDISISSQEWINREEVTSVVYEVLEKYGFRLNKNKSHCYGRGDRRRITGVFIKSDGTLSIGANRKKQLCERLYRYLVHNQGSPQEILGHIYFAMSIDPMFVSSILKKYADYGKAAHAGGVMDVLKKDAAAMR